MKRVHFLALLAPLALGACGGGQKPNVVLITMDTTRADYLSCYGFGVQPPTSPVLDRLAAEGTRFDMTISTAAVTPVSHASILTGLYNNEHGVRVIFAGSGFRLPDGVPTLATRFKDAGYRTIAVHSAFPVSPYFGLGRGFDVIDSFDTEMQQVQVSEEGGEDTHPEFRWNQNYTRRSDDTIDIALEKLAVTDEPFFLWVHLWDPHDTIHVPPQEFFPPPEQMYETDENGRVVLDASGKPKLRRPMKALYAAEIRYMDSQIGRLFERLQETGRWDDTIVAVTADHGQGLSDHDWAAHRILYQEQIHVPLIVRIPGVHQKRVVKDLTRTVDIAPTLLDYAGVPGQDGMSGRTLRPLIEKQPDEPRIAFADQINGYDLNARMVIKRPQDDFVYAVASWPWKLVWRPNHPGQSELYDLASDPAESRNLWAWDHPAAVRLKKELAAEQSWVTAPFPKQAGGAGQAAAMEALERLGYAGGDEEDVSGPLTWEFVCPEHYDQRSAEPAPCPVCSSAMILIAAGK